MDLRARPTLFGFLVLLTSMVALPASAPRSPTDRPKLKGVHVGGAVHIISAADGVDERVVEARSLQAGRPKRAAE